MAGTRIGGTRREFIVSMGAGACSLALSERPAGPAGPHQAPRRPPNVVLILMDDMGYADVGCYGAVGYETPAIDRLATEGLKFTDFYVAQAVCSASRAALLTGCYAERVGIQGALMPWATVGLGPTEETIADVLKKRGYATGCFGKWHLGHHRPFLPLQHGFDEYFGLPYSNDMWPVDFDGKPATQGGKAAYPPLPLVRNNEQVGVIRTLEDQGTLTGLYTEHALRFVDRNRSRPFFLYLPHSMVHIPLGVSPRFRGRSRQGLYGDVIRLAAPPSAKYPGEGGKTLLDGERGTYDFHDRTWIGFEGSDFEAVVDLGKETPVERVACGFLEEQPSWIFLPARVEIDVSADGQRYVPAATLEEKLVPSAAPRVKDYTAAVPKGTPVRFVRIRAASIGTCPSWHVGAGGKAWLFVDEVVVT